MTFYFSIETVYYNAFTAVQDITRELSRDEIKWFCRQLEKEIPSALEKYPETRCTIVNFDMDDHDFFIRERADFCEFGDRVIFSGLDIDDTRLRRINLCLNSRAAKETFRATREVFREHIKALRESADIKRGTVLAAS